MEAIDEKDKYLDKEKKIIQNLILSMINNDGYEEIHKIFLSQTADINNKWIIEFFDSRELEDKETKKINTDSYPVNDLTNKELYDKFDAYIHLFNTKEKLKKYYNLYEDLDYRNDLINFVINYKVSKRILEITKWYFDNNEDIVHDRELFSRLVSMDGERLFALRNILTDKEIELDFDKEDLNIVGNRSDLMTTLHMRLARDYLLANIILISEASIDLKKAFTGTMLFHLLNTSAFLSVAKEYGFSTEELDLETIIKSARIAVECYEDDSKTTKNDYLSYVNEVETLIENADNISTKFNNQKVKKLN